MFECRVHDVRIEFVDDRFLQYEKATIETTEELWVKVRAQGKLHMIPVHSIACISYKEGPK